MEINECEGLGAITIHLLKRCRENREILEFKK